MRRHEDVDPVDSYSEPNYHRLFWYGQTLSLAYMINMNDSYTRTQTASRISFAADREAVEPISLRSGKIVISDWIMQKALRHFKRRFIYRVSHKKGIDKKLLAGPAHGFNSQFLNLFGFSISVSFVWCII